MEVVVPLLKKSNNIFEDILLSKAKRDSNGNVEFVYFYRYIGFDNEKEYLKNLSNLNESLKKLGQLYVSFQNSINLPYNVDLTDKISNCLKSATMNDLKNGYFVSLLNGENLLNLTISYSINRNIFDALELVVKQFIINENVFNESMVINFITKIILWANEYIPNLTKYAGTHNPKVLYLGGIKKHEAYFLVFLSKIGCDVLYINSQSDDLREMKITNDYSMLVEHPIKKKIEDYFKSEATQKQIKDSEYPSVKNTYSSSNNYNFQAKTNRTPEPIKVVALNRVTKLNNAVLLKPNNIFEDIFTDMEEREGYIEGKVVPVYFCRQIGISYNGDLERNDFYNKIYLLDKKLSKNKTGYFKFTNHIQMPSTNEIPFVMSTGGTEHSKDMFLKNLAKTQLFTNINKENEEQVFVWVMDLFEKKEGTDNLSKLSNFAYKIVFWANKYLLPILKRKKSGEKDIPKILYYGDIKSHEVYFLIFASKLGFDVLYINTEKEKDSEFKFIDIDEKHTTLLELEKDEKLDEFPIMERTIRKTTVAYNASKEVQELIYTEDSGIYKSRQFEDRTTRPIILKTTYDELKILWNEEAKIRPEFKIEDNIVYVPNLFAKICGTMEDINEYWKDIAFFNSNKSAYLVSEVPFTEITYTRRELYSSAFLFDKNGLIDRQKLLDSELYKFGYLKTSIQEFIINKINELIKSDMFKQTVDEEFRLRILMTILNLDSNILRLIECFDYPGVTPKLVAYDNKKDIFSVEDAIVMAFLNIIGADVVIFTPTNYNNIEQHLKENLFDIHQMPNVEFDLELPVLSQIKNQAKQSFLGRLFGL